MNPVFFQYTDDNILDRVIDLFVEKGWQSFPKSNTLLNHRYIWPDIVLSDRINGSVENNGVEALGSYTPNACSEMNGYVTLYVQTIKSVAERFKEDCKSDLSLEEIKEKLSALVLVHEFTHWIIQIGFWRDKISSLKMKYDCKDSINFHEALAEIVTNYFCSEDPAMKHIFDWLENKQPVQYRIYRTMLKQNEGVTVETIEIDRVIFSVMIMQLKGKQSYKCLIELYELVPKDNPLNYSALFDLAKEANSLYNHFPYCEWLKDSLTIEECKIKYEGKITAGKFGL